MCANVEADVKAEKCAKVRHHGGKGIENYGTEQIAETTDVEQKTAHSAHHRRHLSKIKKRSA